MSYDERQNITTGTAWLGEALAAIDTSPNWGTLTPTAYGSYNGWTIEVSFGAYNNIPFNYEQSAVSVTIYNGTASGSVYGSMLFPSAGAGGVGADVAGKLLSAATMPGFLFLHIAGAPSGTLYNVDPGGDSSYLVVDVVEPFNPVAGETLFFVSMSWNTTTTTTNSRRTISYNNGKLFRCSASGVLIEDVELQSTLPLCQDAGFYRTPFSHRNSGLPMMNAITVIGMASGGMIGSLQNTFYSGLAIISGIDKTPTDTYNMATKTVQLYVDGKTYRRQTLNRRPDLTGIYTPFGVCDNYYDPNVGNMTEFSFVTGGPYLYVRTA